MPVQWLHRLEKAPAHAGAFSRAEGAAPAAALRLWPNRSLPNRGFVLFIGLSAGLLSLPLIAVLGTPVLWGLLPFIGLALGGVWYALDRNDRDRRILEEVTLWSDQIRVVRHNPRGQSTQRWEANPYWVRLRLEESRGPVESYLILSGGGREIELGRFLSPEERADLHRELEIALARLR